LKNSDISTLVQPWYFEFIRGDPENPFDLETISEIILAANFMLIEPLLELAGAGFASQVRDKTIDELKDLFHIEGDLPPVDCKTIRETYPWAIDNITIE
jgi:S-phase kinase-associated protein 1